MTNFIKQSLPEVGEFFIPDDITLNLPKNIELDKEYWHFLVYNPWNDKYLEYVPEDLQEFFMFVLHNLHARTTDVHTAISITFLDRLISQFEGIEINRRVVAIALILHDSGWSRLSDQEIANSLGVKGLKLNELSMGPKEKHAVESEKIARVMLSKFEFEPKLSKKEKELIYKSIRYHDKPEEVTGGDQEMPIEVKLLVDLDHSWSFAYEGFWMDVVRKGVSPNEYLQNLGRDLDSYFVTDHGRGIARELLEERRAEVEQL